jgi:23S rRNA pseudouridine1911/1915/1917 synthase
MKKKAPFFTIVYEDTQIVAINKASGIAVLPDRWDDSREHLNEMLPYRVWVVHRIDRDTSGLVVFAKTEQAHQKLSNLFETHKIQKNYLAIVQGRPAWDETICELPLSPNGDRSHRTIIDAGRGKPSTTHFKLIGSIGTYSLIQAQPVTGRTHQIRVHLSALGHPIICDPLYGSSAPVYVSSIKRAWKGDSFEERPIMNRTGLHAYSIQLPELQLVASLPKDMKALIHQMEKINGHTFEIPGKLEDSFVQR